MTNEHSQKLILIGHLASAPKELPSNPEFAWVRDALSGAEEEVQVHDLGLIRDQSLALPAAINKETVAVLHLNGELFEGMAPLGEADKQQRSKSIKAIAKDISGLRQIKLVVLSQVNQPELVKQLLLLGVPAVFSIRDKRAAQSVIHSLYVGLNSGLTVRQIVEKIGKEQEEWEFRSQEVQYDPEKEVLDWDLGIFPEGPDWTQGLLYRSNQWRALSWRLRSLHAIPLSERQRREHRRANRQQKQRNLSRLAQKKTEASLTQAHPPVRGNSRALRRGAAMTREAKAREQKTQSVKKRRRNWMITVVLMLVLSAVGIPLGVMYSEGQSKIDPYGLSPCPFPETADELKVVVFPFQIVPGCGPAANRFTDLVRLELSRMKERGYAIDARYQELDNCPSSFEDVMATAEICNTDLFVWGQYLPDSTSKKQYLQVHYVPLAEDQDRLYLEKAELKTRIEGFSITIADSIIASDLRGLAYWGIGIRHMKANEYDQAVAVLSQIEVNNDELRSLISQELTQAYAKAGRYEQARGHFDQLISLHPENVGYYFDRASMLKLMDESEAALADFEKVLELEPNNTEALTQKGLILAQLGRFGEAKEDLNLAIMADPNRADLLARRASIFIDEEKFDQALTDYNQAISLDDQQAELFYQRGRLLQQLGDTENALTDIQRSLELDPNLTGANLFQGDVFMQAEKWEEARDAYTQVLDRRASAESYARRAQANEKLESWSLALDDFEKATGLQVTYTPAWMGKARIFQQLGQRPASLEALNRVLNQQPNHLEALQMRSGYLVDQGKWFLAEVDLEKILEQDPENQEALYRQAAVMLETNRPKEANALVAKVSAEDKQGRRSLLKARIYLGQNASRKALNELTQAKRLNAPASEVLYYQGLAYQKLNNFDLAKEKLEAALAEGGGKMKNYLALGEVYQEEGALSQAKKAFSEVIRQAPDAGMGYLKRARLLHQMQLYDSALQDYDRAINLDSEIDARAYLNRGEVKMALKQYNKALFDFNQAIREDANDFEAYCLRGRLYQLLGNFRQAEGDLQIAEELAPESALPLYYRAIIYEERTRDEEAMDLLDQATSRDPNFADAYNLRGEMYAQQRDFPRAMRDFNEVIRIDPTYSEAYDNLGDVSRRLGNYQAAISYYEKALSHNPNHADALYHRGFIHFLNRSFRRAEEDIKRSLSLEPGHGIRYATLAQIYAIQKNDESFFYYLETALQNGFPPSELRNDPAYAAYSDHPDFERLLN